MKRAAAWLAGAVALAGGAAAWHYGGPDARMLWWRVVEVFAPAVTP